MRPNSLSDSYVWWEKTGEADISGAIESTIKGLQQKQSGRIRQLTIDARLYGNASLVGMAGFGAAPLSNSYGGKGRERLSRNIVQSVIDTATARIGENKPRPYYLTSGGTYKQQRKAKRLNWFSEGLFYEQKVYRKGSDAQRDAEIFGDGFLYCYENELGRVAYERVLGAELWVDEMEAIYDNPRQMHRVRLVDRHKLCGTWPDKRDIIMNADRASTQAMGAPANMADMLVVRESWHLRSSPKAKDGKHCVSINGHLLEPLSDWNHDFFPFARFRWTPMPAGYWSQGLAKQLAPKQIEINRILYTIQRSFELAATYKVFLEDGSKIVTEHINNDLGVIIKYRGTPPQWFVPQVVPPEYYQQLATLVASCYEDVGINIQSATGTKPAGLNSGEAQRVYRDTVNERSKTQEGLNEEGYMDASRIGMALAHGIAERDGHYEVEAPAKGSLRVTRMTADELDSEGWDSQCFPTSSLPKDPSGRLQTIQEYIQAGFMTPRQGRRALDFPDLEAIESLANAEEDLLTKILDDICEGKDFQPPEPTDDLHLAKELSVEYINRGRMQELEEERIDDLRTWSAQVDALLQAALPPAPPPGMPGAPQAAPMAPPQSDLIPNAPGGGGAPPIQ